MITDDEKEVVANVRAALDSLNKAIEAAGYHGIKLEFFDARAVDSVNPIWFLKSAVKQENVL